jgi:hypothetical protein
MAEKAISGQNWKGPVRCYEVNSVEADFEKMTWTFQIDADTRVSGGRYLLIHEDDLRAAVNG